MADRTVHARGKTIEVVRYDRAGKWRIENIGGGGSEPVTLSEAVSVALDLERNRGKIFLGRSGGGGFDRKVKEAPEVADTKQEWSPHPDYGSGEPGDERGDRCVCGGIRHWHAVAPHGCDDCACTAFSEADR